MLLLDDDDNYASAGKHDYHKQILLQLAIDPVPSWSRSSRRWSQMPFSRGTLLGTSEKI